jgi:tripartite-type tricarboxylate transporter receptor subunit TctC
VPYRGGAPAMQDLIAGHVDIMCDLAANSLPQLRNGNIKAFAIMAKSRWFAAPDVPTSDEAGLSGIYVYTWHGLWAPKGVPDDVVPKLNAALVAALADPGVRSRIAGMGMEIPPRDQQTPVGLATLEKAEIEKWWPIIKAANIKGE